jgi:tetratricopeptide (TPR) repeat protein
LALDPKAAFAAWDEAMANALFRFDRPGQQALLELARLPERWADLPAQARATWHWRRGQSEYYSHLWQAALEDYEQALGLFSTVGARLGEANVLKAQGDVLAFLDQRQEALDKYEQALGLFRTVGASPGEANVLQAQGDAALRGGETEQGLALLDAAFHLYEAIGARTGTSNVGIALARYVASQQNWQAAIRYMQPAVDFCRAIGHPLAETLQAEIDYWQSQLRYAVLFAYHKAEDWAGLAAAAMALIEQGEVNGQIWSLLGDARSNLDDEAGAAEAYAQAVTLQPDSAMLRRNYANTLIHLGRLDQAAAQLDAAAALEPEAPYLALRRAELAKAHGQRSAARQWAQTALARQPGWDEAQAILTWAQE